MSRRVGLSSAAGLAAHAVGEAKYGMKARMPNKTKSH